MDFYQVLISYNPSDLSSDAKDAFKALDTNVIKSYRESQFLFDEKSRMYSILDEMNSKSFAILGVKEHGKELAAADPIVFRRMYDESQEALKWIGDNIPILERAMARYLNFYRISA